MLILWSFDCVAQSPSCSTRLGVFGGASPARKSMMLDIAPQAMRIIIDDFEIRRALDDQVYFNLLINHFSELRSSGIETIFCIRFPKDTVGTDLYKQDRIPTKSELDNSLSFIKEFLREFDEVVDYYQLQNEVMGGPGVYLETRNVCGMQGVPVFMGDSAFNWLDTLAFTAKNYIEQEQLAIKIISPSITGVVDANKSIGPLPFYYGDNGVLVCGGNHIPYSIEKIVQIAKKYCDAIDIHLNVSGLLELQSSVLYMDSVRAAQFADSIMFTTTEWNQAKEKQDEINDTAHYYNQFITDAIANPVSHAEWSLFMDSLNYDTTFVLNSFAFMQQHNFLHACYNGITDDPSNLIFLPVALLPLNTVVSGENEKGNQPFYDIIKSLSTNSPASFNLEFNQVQGQGLAFQFENITDTITSKNYEFKWRFGDGDSSLVVSPYHTYNNEGQFNVVLQATNSFGCTDSIKKTISVTSVSAKRLERKNLFLSPQPANSQLRFLLPGSPTTVIVTVYDASGKKFFTGRFDDNDGIINVSMYPSGIYFVHLLGENGKVYFSSLSVEH